MNKTPSYLTSGLLAFAVFCLAPTVNVKAQLQSESLGGDRKSNEVDVLVDLGNAALKKGDAAGAMNTFKAALALLPPKHHDQAKRADIVLLLAQAQMSVPDLIAARESLEKNWLTFDRHPDPERMDRAHYFMMSILMQSSDFKSAEKYSSGLVNRYGERHGQTHPLTLDAQLNHGTVLVNIDQTDNGTKLLDGSFDAMSQNGDKNFYHGRLSMIAINFEGSGNFSLATRYYERLIRELEVGPISRELGVTYFNLAVLNKSQRKLNEALTLHEKALDVLNTTAGPDDIDTIAAVSGLGNTYTVMGRPASGVQFLEQGYERAKKVLGENNNETWMYGNNYANALREIEKFEDARAVDQAAYDWRVKNLGPNDPATEISTLNLGLDWMGLKRFAEADVKFEELYQSRVKRLGENHPDTKEAAKFVLLSQSYNPKKSNNKNLSSQDIGKLDRLTANIQAGAADKNGNLKLAMQLHRRSFEASITENGPIDPTTLLMLRNFALSQYEVEGESTNNVKTYEDLSQRTLAWARTEIAVTAGNARAEDIRRVANRMIYDVIRMAQHNPQAHHVLFQVLMDWKGLSTTEQSLLNQLRNNPPNEKVAKLVARLEELQTALRTPGHTTGQVESDIRLAEVKLAEFSTSFFRTRSEADLKPRDVIAHLKSNEVLIDFIIGDRILPNSTAVEQEVFAFVTTADGSAIVKDLGKLSDITEIIAKPEFQTKPAQRAKLYNILLKPVLKMKSLAKIKHYFIVPDGELFLVPFEGLLNEKGVALGETADVTLMRSATGLLLAANQPAKNASMLLVGAPNYGTGDGSDVFPALPGALQEVIDIEKIAQRRGISPTVITEQGATEAVVRQAVHGQNIVHMATHGFFLPKDFDSALEPPWRGGLALQGANAAVPNGQAKDDGIAFAAELSSWAFDKTDLVVLSACETASGERSYVEGLRGIPAALAVSGAKRSLLALWSVPDEGAANFMTAFYKHLFEENLQYEDAFRATKRDAISGQIIGAETPEVWQAFVMIRN